MEEVRELQDATPPRRRQADDGGVLHHVQRQARDGEEPGRWRAVSFVCFGPRRRGDGARPRRGAVVTMLRAGMGKIPNYFKSAQKELLSLGGKLIDKMKDYDKDNIPTMVRARGVPAVPSRRRRDSSPGMMDFDGNAPRRSSRTVLNLQ